MLPKLRPLTLSRKWLAVFPHIKEIEKRTFTCDSHFKRILVAGSKDITPVAISKPYPIADAFANKLHFRRGIFTATPLYDEKKTEGADTERDEELVNEEESNDKLEETGAETGHKKQLQNVPVERHLNKDRSKIISVDTSIRYMKSAAYKETYGDNLIWVLYRRNFKGQFAPKRTRKTCIRNGQLSTGNPCPICRDEYLVVHHCNVGLLKQFISPHNGEIIGYDKTGVCRRQHERLLIAIDKAKDYGLISFDVPFREYDYKEYEKVYASY